MDIATRDAALAADAADELRDYRRRFRIPADVVYLDGNSLGAPSDLVARALADLHDEWADDLVDGWDRWLRLPTEIGDELGTVLLGAAAGQVVVADSTTVNLYKAVSAAVGLRRGRTSILIEADGFPTDRYVVERLSADVRRVPVTEIIGAFDDSVALVVASAVDFRTAELADVDGITRAAHEAGALALWDVSHAVGAVPLDLDAWEVDFAVGCTYKYVNSGPGAPAFLYVAREFHDEMTQPIPGWFGHADQFAMEPAYRPAVGVSRFLTGTPNVPGMVAVRAGIAMIADAGLDRLREKSVRLTQLAIERADALGIDIATPRDASRRGSHIAVRHPRAAALRTALAARHRVITDHRPPDIVRLGFAPLYNRFVDVWDAFEALAEVMPSATR